MSFGGVARVGISVQGLNEIIQANAAMLRELPQVRTQVHKESATILANFWVSGVHVITGRTKASIKVERADALAGIVSAGFGGPFEERRPGEKGGTPHEAGKASLEKTALQLPRIVKTQIDALFARHRTR
jgi:hypothetical protein